MVQYQSFAFWFFLPTAVGYLQSFLYSLCYRAGDPKPQPGSAQYQIHRRQLHITCLIIFFLFSVYQTHWEIQQEGDLYSFLGVSPDTDERGINSRWRRIGALLHPDKFSDATKREEASKQYVLMNEYRDVLADNARRYAYDRLGPSILKLDQKKFKTIWDFVQWGGQQAMVYHIGSLIAVIVLQYLGLNSTRFRYWQALTIVILLTTNLHVITHPVSPPMLRHINFLLKTFRAPEILPFQFLRILSTIGISGFIALNQTASIPPVPGKRPAVPSDGQTEMHNHQQLNNITNLNNQLNADVLRLLDMEAKPFQGDEAAKRELAERMSDWIVHNTVQADPKVRNLVGQAMAKRREGVPAGARGTR